MPSVATGAELSPPVPPRPPWMNPYNDVVDEVLVAPRPPIGPPYLEEAAVPPPPTATNVVKPVELLVMVVDPPVVPYTASPTPPVPAAPMVTVKFPVMYTGTMRIDPPPPPDPPMLPLNPCPPPPAPTNTTFAQAVFVGLVNVLLPAAVNSETLGLDPPKN